MSDKFPKAAPSPTMPAVMDGEIYKSVGKYSRSAVLYAFEQMGGPPALTNWAEQNPDEFYTKLFPKIIARESEVTHHKTVDQLMDVIDGDFTIDGEIEGASDSFESIPQVAHNWNASDADFADDAILSAASHKPEICAVAHKDDFYAEEYDAVDFVEFDE